MTSRLAPGLVLLAAACFASGQLGGLPGGVILVVAAYVAFLTGRAEAAAQPAAGKTAALEREIAGHRQAQRRLLEIQAHLSNAQEISLIGSWDCDLASNRISGSPELHRIYGTTPENFPARYEQFLDLVHPEDREAMRAAVARSRRTQEPFSYYHRILRPDGTIRMLHGRGRVIAANGGPAHLAGTSQDVTERKAVEKTLALQAEALGRSNAELRAFAYVASHDLQEPLRTVGAFAQLLKKRYGGRLGADADEIIGFVTDGAQHMQSLIDALLAYFRVNDRGIEIAAVDSGAVLSEVVADLNAKIAETGASVEHAGLPKVAADAALLADLFSNLIANAIKYRGASPARVRVSATTSGGLCEFAVADNGIGIDPRHHERVFRVFQRLHTRDEYPGTGIGLSICQRIVERHGGRLWVDSSAGHGATFRFTLPEARP